jgi:pyridoxamine 5'-phosphate oxidase-like protein
MFDRVLVMTPWSQFAAAEPRLAAAIHQLIYQYGQGLGYLATVRADGGPRVHPVSPVVAEGGLFCFVLDSPKRRDLERDGRYALHAFPPESNDDEAYLLGRARRVTNADTVRILASAMRAEPRVDWRLYEFGIDVAVLVRRGQAPTSGPSDAPTERYIWRDPAAAGRTAAGDSIQ